MCDFRTCFILFQMDKYIKSTTSEIRLVLVPSFFKYFVGTFDWNPS